LAVTKLSVPPSSAFYWEPNDSSVVTALSKIRDAQRRRDPLNLGDRPSFPLANTLRADAKFFAYLGKSLTLKTCLNEVALLFRQGAEVGRNSGRRFVRHEVQKLCLFILLTITK
jgi:hypothetical protein